MRVSDNLHEGVKGWAQRPDWTVQMWVQEKVQAVCQHIFFGGDGEGVGGFREVVQGGRVV